jgi:hypothetical protein
MPCLLPIVQQFGCCSAALASVALNQFIQRDMNCFTCFKYLLKSIKKYQYPSAA